MMRSINNGLLILDLSFNPDLTESSYKLLATVLKKSDFVSLQELNLEGNRMGNAKAMIIIKALASVNKLTYLNMNKNQIGDPLATHIYDLLRNN